MSFKDIVSAFNQTGDMLLKHPTMPNGQAISGVPNPVIEMKGGFGTSLTECVAAVQFFINNMREKIGVGAVTDGSQGQPDTLVGVAQIAEQGTSNVLRNMLMAYRYVKGETFDKMAYRYEIRGKSELLQNYQGIVGVETIDFMKFFSKRHHGVNITALIDDNVKQEIMQMAQVSLNAAKQGSVGITMADYFVISRLCEQGLLKSAEVYLSYKEEKNKKDAQALQEQNMALNGQNMQAQEEAKMKSGLQLIQAQTAASIQEQAAKLHSDVTLQNQKFQEELMKELKVMAAQYFYDDKLLDKETKLAIKSKPAATVG